MPDSRHNYAPNSTSTRIPDDELMASLGLTPYNCAPYKTYTSHADHSRRLPKASERSKLFYHVDGAGAFHSALMKSNNKSANEVGEELDGKFTEQLKLWKEVNDDHSKYRVCQFLQTVHYNQGDTRYSDCVEAVLVEAKSDFDDIQNILGSKNSRNNVPTSIVLLGTIDKESGNDKGANKLWNFLKGSTKNDMVTELGLYIPRGNSRSTQSAPLGSMTNDINRGTDLANEIYEGSKGLTGNNWKSLSTNLTGLNGRFSDCIVVIVSPGTLALFNDRLVPLGDSRC
ncbi:uncharacterized protein L201_002230 [Kwoniella dendrophila CBS 6074]|uniref:Uncharacterized protein n=1 Tax=Kwoniella dendrophila CBS 6074 TaxID=1295534 RepID=A0AAX4JPM2_9TREE